MKQVTNKERHEVARRLREFSKDRWSLTVGGNSATIRYAISDIVFGDKKYHSEVDLLDRLADLIDSPTSCPYYHDDRHYCLAHEDMLASDRDVLLALADEMDDLVEAWGGKYPTNRVAAYARCIREALGE